MKASTARAIVTVAIAAVSQLAGPARAGRAATVTVTTSADSGQGSLRSALLYAQQHPSTTIAFNIPAAQFEKGVAAIRVLTALPAISNDNTVIDGNTQPNSRSGGRPAGPGTPPVVLKGTVAGADEGDNGGGLTVPVRFAAGDAEGADESVNGLMIVAAHCVLNRLAINDFSGAGVVIAGARAQHNRVTGCFVGTSAAGIKPFPNEIGIVIGNGAADNIIGGTNPAERNLISGNAANGVQIEGDGSSRNSVQGNLIGTDLTGEKLLPNGVNGVQISDGASANRIGGIEAGARNVISGSGFAGVLMTRVHGNSVQGNYIGTDATGTKAMGNHVCGVNICVQSTDNVVGGTTPGARNVIASNQDAGVDFRDAGTEGNSVLGNYLGTDASGTRALGNDFGVIILEGAQKNTVGGIAAGARNVISGNKYDGVDIRGDGTASNAVEGNYLGTDAAGSAAVPNGGSGVVVRAGAQGNTIGGLTPAARNVISGNATAGVALGGDRTAENRVEGNFIGLDATGTKAVSNGYGIDLALGSHHNTVGGSAADARNVISSSKHAGIVLHDAKTSKNAILGNYLGTNASGQAMPDTSLQVMAIYLYAGANANTVGGTAPGEGNLIAFNDYGVVVEEEATTGNTIRGNSIRATRSDGKHLGITLYSSPVDTHGLMVLRPPTGARGPNHLINYPVLSDVTATDKEATISGFVLGAPGKEYALDFFASPAVQPARYGEGHVYLGSTNVTMTGRNNTQFTYTVAGDFRGKSFTGTATELDTGDTSELSAPRVAAP